MAARGGAWLSSVVAQTLKRGTTALVRGPLKTWRTVLPLMRPLDLAAGTGFLLTAAGGALLYERAPSLPGMMLPLVAVGLAVLLVRRAGVSAR
jgi:hypothetical protein